TPCCSIRRSREMRILTSCRPINPSPARVRSKLSPRAADRGSLYCRKIPNRPPDCGGGCGGGCCCWNCGCGGGGGRGACCACLGAGFLGAGGGAGFGVSDCTLT